MSTFVDLLPQTLENVFEPETEIAQEEYRPTGPVIWDSDSFAEEQIRGLVRQVFFPGWPKPARQVVFSAVDPATDTSEICLQVALTLSAQVSGSACLVEADESGHGLQQAVEKRGLSLVPAQGSVNMLESSRPLSNHLCLVPRNVFLGENENGSSGLRLRDRLAELRRSFDYTLIHGPASGTCTEAALLGSLCDGVVLVVEANSTRRVTAQKVKERLHSANARLLGAVLSQRTFPIPQAIYRRL
jgi:protein-tyrosine kinase